MKRSEIAMIILIASLSMLLTFTLVQSFLGDKVKRNASVRQATSISQDLSQPAERIFNKGAINPTVEVCVEKNSTESSAADCVGSTAETSTATPQASDQQSTNTTN